MVRGERYQLTIERPAAGGRMIARHDGQGVVAGGRDPVVPVRYFYPALNKLEALGHPEVRFTNEEDMGHLAWVRVYAGQREDPRTCAGD